MRQESGDGALQASAPRKRPRLELGVARIVDLDARGQRVVVAPVRPPRLLLRNLHAIHLFEHDSHVFIARSSTDVNAIGTHGSNLSLRGGEPPTGARINGRVGDQMDSVLVLHELTAGLRYIAFLWAIGSKQLAFS